jgi:hypothetical protein|tara:strand:- start:779 stop:1159 length:381 start_codon:yes stop_codon:yes gene_type:complete
MNLSNNINWLYVILATLLFVFAQAGAWLQHNLQFKYPKFGPEWWGWYVAALPITWLFLKATQYGVNGFGGSLWANRFLGFSTGMLLYGVLTNYFFDQPMTMKIWVQVGLCLVIMCVQVFWKEPIIK